MSEDGKRLFFSQCFNVGYNASYQHKIETGETVQIGGSYKFCLSNGLAFRDEVLYGTVFSSCRIIKLDISAGDLENPVVSDVTTAVAFPGGIGFNSKGAFHAVDGVKGDLFRVDLENEDVGNNAELLATLPSALESVALDKDDRLYVAAFFSGTVWEVLSSTDFRVVVD